MKGDRRARLAAATIGLAIVSVACDSTETAAGETTQVSVRAENAAATALLPTDVFALPAFDFTTYETLLAQLRGTPVVVNIWSSWCGPCRREAEELADAAAKYASEVQFLGVDILDERGAAADFLDEYGVPYPSVFDASGEIRDRLGFIGQPETLFYDAQGQIAAVWTGPLTPDVLQDSLDKISPHRRGRSAFTES
jgi:thiol-disulfide isomerase/thioredoxin